MIRKNSCVHCLMYNKVLNFLNGTHGLSYLCGQWKFLFCVIYDQMLLVNTCLVLIEVVQVGLKWWQLCQSVSILLLHFLSNSKHTLFVDGEEDDRCQLFFAELLDCLKGQDLVIDWSLTGLSKLAPAIFYLTVPSIPSHRDIPWLVAKKDHNTLNPKWTLCWQRFIKFLVFILICTPNTPVHQTFDLFEASVLLCTHIPALAVDRRNLYHGWDHQKSQTNICEPARSQNFCS